MPHTLPAAIIHEEEEKEHSVSTLSMKHALSDAEEPRDQRTYEKPGRSYAEEGPHMKDMGKWRKLPSKDDYDQNERERLSREDDDQRPAGSRYEESTPRRTAGYDRHYYRTGRTLLETERPPEATTTWSPKEDGRWTADAEPEDREPSRKSTENATERDEVPENKGRRDQTPKIEAENTTNRGLYLIIVFAARRHPRRKALAQPPAEKPAALSTTEDQVENGMKPYDKERSDDKNPLVDKENEDAPNSVKQLLTVGEWLKILVSGFHLKDSTHRYSAPRRCECCYWIRFWSALGAFSMAVLLPLGVVLLPHTAHISPLRDPGYDSAGDSGFRQSIEKALNLSYNEEDFEIAPQSCDYAPYAAAHFGDVPSKTYRGANAMGTQYRHVICVFDSGYMWGSGTVTTFAYTPYDIQVQYCNAIVHYSMMIGQAGPQFKAGRLRGKKVSEALKALASSRHRGADVPVYLTLGGSWEDSYAIHEAVSNATIGEAVVDFVANNKDFYSASGYAILDWSQAGVGNPTVDFPSFVKLFKSRSLRVMLTVPPLPHLLGPYQLSRLLPELDHVVISTHKLRSPGEVTCAGERRLTTAAFLRIRHLYASPSADSAVADKFVYALSQWKSKTAYPFVCDLQVSDTKSDKECVMALGSAKGEVAAFARAEDLCRRMRKAYDDGIGDAPVAVFDVQLDDPAGRCKLKNSRGPLLRIVAEAGPFDC
ncbi:hypothetical protein HPB49_021134 [Dermacentor silvarum]|uniref:Uncharacterized protein n=1 Tax=Dermacentor silvarum TaxID=543639 RepID=A0ACB8DKQ2_DERSI|nr:hypothetical protein HPB49_021134 [Dermacentor silvarum]